MDGKPTYERVMEGLKKLAEAYGEEHYQQLVIFQPVLTLSGIEEFRETIRFFGEEPLVKGNLVHPVPVNSLPSHFKDKDSTPRALLHAMEVYYDEFSNPPPLIAELLDKELARIHTRPLGILKNGEIPANGACTLGTRKLFVPPKGSTLHPCQNVGYELVIGDVDKGIDMGSVNKLTQAYVELCQEYCTKCWGNGICPSCYLNPPGPDSNCDAIRNFLDAMLGLYTSIFDRYGKDGLNRLEMKDTRNG